MMSTRTDFFSLSHDDKRLYRMRHKPVLFLFRFPYVIIICFKTSFSFVSAVSECFILLSIISNPPFSFSSTSVEHSAVLICIYFIISTSVTGVMLQSFSSPSYGVLFFIVLLFICKTNGVHYYPTPRLKSQRQTTS